MNEIQAKEKVGRRRAIQILTGEDEFPATKSTKFPTHFICQMNPEQKKEIQPLDDSEMLHTGTRC